WIAPRLVALEAVQKWRDRIGMTAVHRKIMGVLCVSRMTDYEVTDSQHTSKRAVPRQIASPLAVPGCACLRNVSALNAPLERRSWYVQAAPRSADLLLSRNFASTRGERRSVRVRPTAPALRARSPTMS